MNIFVYAFLVFSSLSAFGNDFSPLQEGVYYYDCPAAQRYCYERTTWYRYVKPTFDELGTLKKVTIMRSKKDGTLVGWPVTFSCVEENEEFNCGNGFLMVRNHGTGFKMKGKSAYTSYRYNLLKRVKKEYGHIYCSTADDKGKVMLYLDLDSNEVKNVFAGKFSYTWKEYLFGEDHRKDERAPSDIKLERNYDQGQPVYSIGKKEKLLLQIYSDKTFTLEANFCHIHNGCNSKQVTGTCSSVVGLDF